MNRFVRSTRLAYQLAQPKFVNYCSSPDSETKLCEGCKFLREENKKLSERLDGHNNDYTEFKYFATFAGSTILMLGLLIIGGGRK